jgi:hypothetical protein
MDNFLTQRLIVVWLFSTLILGMQSCNDGSPQLEKSKVQFSLSSGTASQGRVQDSDLPENARLRISIKSRSGTPVFANHEIQVLKVGEGYMADPLELLPGNYVITDFMIVDDSEVLNATPKSESPFSEFVMHSLPYNFSVIDNSVAKVSMQVIDARNEKPEAFGYASFRVNKANTLSFIVLKAKGGQTSLREATAELRQGKHLIKTFSVGPGMNKIAFEGEPDAMYTLSVYAGEAAKVKTFNFKELKKELGAKPLKINLEPALLLTMESSVDEGNEYEEYFEFVLEGTGGAVNINWGNGHEGSGTLPLTSSHEYTIGTYTVIVTGDLDQITNLYGFSYGTYIYAIRGLTNLTALKTYNPSWGAVPIKVDLSNCKYLETIHVEKYGAPYEPIDLRTDFKLPEEHFIKEFVFNVPSPDATRENISPEELEVLVDNIYNNATRRDIYDGNFYVYPVETPSPGARQKLDILRDEYDWDVSLAGNIGEDYSEVARAREDLDARRENWLRQKFSDGKQIRRKAKMARTN